MLHLVTINKKKVKAIGTSGLKCQPCTYTEAIDANYFNENNFSEFLLI